MVYADRITRAETDAKGDEAERSIPFMKGYTVRRRQSRVPRR
jgi:antirestriction protein ArdC